jgi:hypothetical protein
MALLVKLSLPETHSVALFEFIKLILPENSLAESFYLFNKSFKNSMIREVKLCNICNRKFVKNECPSSTCSSRRQEKKISIKKSIKIVMADIRSQINVVLQSHYNTIIEYKYKLQHLKSQGLITDICNGSEYELKENTITLLLFTDAVTYTKSVANSMWAIFSCICELPPLLRQSYENIIFRSLWSGDLEDFNLYFKDYNYDIDDIILNGLTFNDMKINVNVKIFTGDTPARCKALNCVYFNGKMGCIMCYHPTARHSNKKTTVYPIIGYTNIKNCTQTDYLNDLNTCLATNEITNGIKGETYLYNWIKIPNSILIDYIHLCLIGTFKKIIFDYFNLKNKKKQFYLGK